MLENIQVGTEVQLTLLFADVRGSTALAEDIGASAFHHLINRFYTASTGVLVQTNALIEKLIGDEVAGLYVPGIAGPDHARVAVDAARAIPRALRVSGPAGVPSDDQFDAGLTEGPLGEARLAPNSSRHIAKRGV